jgi:hypothetical protein
MDTADTGLAGCGLWAGVRLLLTGETAEQLKGCYIPVGTTFYFTYEEDSGMDPTVAPTPEPAFTGPPAALPAEPVAPQSAPAPQPSGNTVVAETPVPTADNLGDLAQKVDDPVLVVTLAIIALLGVGLWKHLGKVADQKSALEMKKLEIEADSVKRTPKAQPPPCQAANTALEAKISALEARLGKVESSSLALPAGFDAEELDERVRKLELERIKKD